MIITVLGLSGKTIGIFFKRSCYNHFTLIHTCIQMDHSNNNHEPEQGFGTSSIVNRFLEFFVRASGIFLLVIGLVLGFMVLKEAWLLYNQPTNIERFVVAIESGSNLDKVFAPAAEPVAIVDTDSKPGLTDFQQGPPEQRLAVRPTPVTGGFTDFRLAYFPAWFIAIVLLLLIGRLAIAAVKTGGELALFNVLTKRAVRELLREIRRS